MPRYYALIVLVLVACTPRASLEDAKLLGRVVDQASRIGIASAGVQFGNMVVYTDVEGRFAVNRPSRPADVVSVRHRWYRATTLEVPSDPSTELVVTLESLGEVCCELRGAWDVTLWNDAGSGRDSVLGELVFEPNADLESVAPTRYAAATSSRETGRFSFEPSVVLGRAVRSEVPPGLDAAGEREWRALFRSVLGEVHVGDSVSVMVGVGSGEGLRLRGAFEVDVIRGEWRSGSDRGAGGMFQMARRGQ